ncbi:MAG: hypothetical protein HC811_13105, partial [Flammeovirgaceae bacterium]|nr:hypothetical protein [Flammeovirgaceae bacterium]
KLIKRIKETDDEKLLEEAYRLLEMETEGFETYKLTMDQKKAIDESRAQIKKGQSLTNEQVNSDSDEWLEK